MVRELRRTPARASASVAGSEENAPPGGSNAAAATGPPPRATRTPAAGVKRKPPWPAPAPAPSSKLPFGTPKAAPARSRLGLAEPQPRVGAATPMPTRAARKAGAAAAAAVHSAEVPYFGLQEDPSFWEENNVQVVVRVRPLSNAEKDMHSYTRCLKQDSAKSITWIRPPETRFTFDHIACETVDQEEIFRVASLPIVEKCVAGYNCCIFAYGQTGSGKTHTMLGETSDLDVSPSPNRGITPRTFEFLFERIRAEEERRRDEKLKYKCKCSFLEIYNEKITDLLDTSSINLELHEDTRKGFYVKNLTEHEASCVGDIMQLLMLARCYESESGCYRYESWEQSHSIFTCTVESTWEKDSMSNLQFARLNLVDLAGSERTKASGAEGGQLKEAANINRSLSTLGLVVMRLVDLAQGKQVHVPYRDSRLTLLLKDSLGGNSKTMIIVNLGPSVCSDSETLSTLQFAQRARLIQNNAIVNEDSSGDVPALLHQIRLLKEEIAFLGRQQVARSLSRSADTDSAVRSRGGFDAGTENIIIPKNESQVLVNEGPSDTLSVQGSLGRQSYLPHQGGLPQKLTHSFTVMVQPSTSSPQPQSSTQQLVPEVTQPQLSAQSPVFAVQLEVQPPQCLLDPSQQELQGSERGSKIKQEPASLAGPSRITNKAPTFAATHAVMPTPASEVAPTVKLEPDGLAAAVVEPAPIFEDQQEPIEISDDSYLDEEMQESEQSDVESSEACPSDKDYELEASEPEQHSSSKQCEQSSASEQLELDGSGTDIGQFRSEFESEEQVPPPAVEPVVEVLEADELPPLAPVMPRMPINYSRVHLDELRRLRKRNHYKSPRTATDRRFWSIEQQDLYTSLYRKAKLAAMKWIDWEHIKSTDQFAGVRENCAYLGLEEIMSYRCDWDDELIKQFYSTVHINKDKTSITWMSDGKKITTNKRAWEELFGIPAGVYAQIHGQPVLGDNDKNNLYTAADYSLGNVNGLSPLASIAYRILRTTIYPRKGDRGSIHSHSWNILHHIVTRRHFDIVALLYGEIDLLIGVHEKRALMYAPYIMGLILRAFPYEGPRETSHLSYKSRESETVGPPPAAPATAPNPAAAPVAPAAAAAPSGIEEQPGEIQIAAPSGPPPAAPATAPNLAAAPVAPAAAAAPSGIEEQPGEIQPTTLTDLQAFRQFVEDSFRSIGDRLGNMEDRLTELQRSHMLLMQHITSSSSSQVPVRQPAAASAATRSTQPADRRGALQSGSR